MSVQLKRPLGKDEVQDLYKFELGKYFVSFPYISLLVSLIFCFWFDAATSDIFQSLAPRHTG